MIDLFRESGLDDGSDLRRQIGHAAAERDDRLFEYGFDRLGDTGPRPDIESVGTC